MPQRLEQLRSVCSGAFFSANSGTYEVSGSSLTTRPMVAKWPNFMDGGSAWSTYRVEGGYLHLSTEGFRVMFVVDLGIDFLKGQPGISFYAQAV